MVLWDEAIIADRAYPWAPSRQPFTAAEDRAIVWAYGRGWTLGRIADQCRRHPSVVQWRVTRLIADGVLTRRPPLPGRRPWTAADLRYLQCHWGQQSDAEVAAALGRTVDACKIRATRVLHQSRGDMFLSGRETGRLLGVNEKTVLRWAHDGHIHVKRSAVGCGGRRPWWSDGPRRQWAVSPTSLLDFFRDCPWLIPPLERMPDQGHWLAGAARAAWEVDPWLTVEEVAAQVHFVPVIVRHWIVREQVVPHQRRPKYGSQAGPWQGRVVIRQSEVALLVARREALIAWREYAARQARRAPQP